MKAPKLTHEMATRWAAQAAADAEKWTIAAAPNVAEPVIKAYAQGVRQGYMQAIADLKMHGILPPTTEAC